MKRILLFLFILNAYNTFAQKRDQFTPIEESNYFGFHFDDDFLFLDNRDEQYTGGLTFELIQISKRSKEKTGIFNPFKFGQRYWNYSIGGFLYTPYNVSDSNIILNDRPFSSYIYTSFGYSAYSKHKRKKLTTELFLGFVGSDLPGEIQELIHTIGESPPANGWKNKIASKETVLPNLRVNYQENVVTFGPLNALVFRWMQIGKIGEINAGLFANNIKGGLKIGFFNQPPPTLSKRNYTFGKNHMKRDVSQHKKIKLSGFFSTQLELVAYNTSLQSLPWLNSAYFITPELINRHVWLLEGGLQFKYKKFHLSYTIRARSEEFKKFKRNWHSWAGVTIGKSF